MKQIVHEFGASILALLSVLLLIGILLTVSSSGQDGIKAFFGLSNGKESDRFSEYKDFAAVSNWYQRKAPAVFFADEKGRCFTGEETILPEYFYVKDSEDNRYDLRKILLENQYADVVTAEIRDIRNADGESVLEEYDERSGEICFENPGIYRVCICVTDKENKEALWNIPLVVDEGGRA